MTKKEATFEILFELKPPKLFGLPDTGWIIVPSDTKQMYGPTLDTVTFNKVGHETLSVFRSDTNKFSVEFDLDRYHVRVEDNYLTVTTRTHSHELALSKALELVDKLLLFWSALSGRGRITRKLLQITDTDKNRYPMPRFIEIMQVHTYELSKFRENLTEAGNKLSSMNASLERSLVYFDRFLFLQEIAQDRNLLDNLRRESGYLISEMLLNLYKGITTILGDPSNVGDKDYQSRFKKYGLAENFWAENVEPIKIARDNMDVAHYTISDSPQELREKISHASTVCRQVIKAYSDWLAAQNG